MIINADTLLPHLKEKVRPSHSDTSRHLLCPHCGIRTKLNTLADGRRKCSVCGRKFRIHKMTDGIKLQQCGEILMCFCLDFSPQRTTQITRHRYRLVSVFYDHFRRLIAEHSLPPDKIPLLSAYANDIHVMRNKSRCRWCKGKIRASERESRPPVFAVQFRKNGEVTIDPLKDEEAALHFGSSGSSGDVQHQRQGYAGFICCGTFHRLTTEKNPNDESEQLWTWIRERTRTQRGIWKRNTGYSLKELEWKYNNRLLDPDVQAKKIIALMPMDFLTTWLLKTDEPARNQTGA